MSVDLLTEHKVGRGYKRASDEEIIAAYKMTRSVWKAGKLLGLAGQSVQERLKRLNVEIAHVQWTDEEVDELKTLFEDPHLSISEVSKRLDRTKASISCKANELGIKKNLAIKQKRIPRGSGYDKISIKKHLEVIDKELCRTPLTKYCRKNGMNVDSFVRSTQMNFPLWWEEYTEAFSIEVRVCKYCKENFFPMNKKQVFCTRKCSGDSTRDKNYFGGNRINADGVKERICQICLKNISNKAKLHVHHVYGKNNDLDNKYLVATCSRCHMTLEQIVLNPEFDNNIAWIRMMKFVWMKNHGILEENKNKELSVMLIREPIEKRC